MDAFGPVLFLARSQTDADVLNHLRTQLLHRQVRAFPHAFVRNPSYSFCEFLRWKPWLALATLFLRILCERLHTHSETTEENQGRSDRMAGFGRSNSLSINTSGGLLYVSPHSSIECSYSAPTSATAVLGARIAVQLAMSTCGWSVLTISVETMRTKDNRQASPRAAEGSLGLHSNHNKHSQDRSSAANPRLPNLQAAVSLAT
jgi:hypothetical protein